jgi:hypothetical protein
MSDQTKRQDQKTAEQVREALAMQRAFGDHAARAFLSLRGVHPELVHRVLTAPREKRRY